MEIYLLDTCAWIDALLAPELLSDGARDILASPDRVHLCTISLLEFARKETRGEIKITMPCEQWLEEVALPREKITLTPISPKIVIDATRLPDGFRNLQGKPHKDPADQIITATARKHKFTLLTSDKILLNYQAVKTLSSRK